MYPSKEQSFNAKYKYVMCIIRDDYPDIRMLWSNNIQCAKLKLLQDNLTKYEQIHLTLENR